MDITVGFTVPTELPRDVARQQINGKQVIDPVQPTVALERPQVGVGHLRAQGEQAVIGQLAVLHELCVASGDQRGEQLAMRDLDHELTFQAEHDVQEVDGLRAQIPFQGRGGLDVVFLHAQCLHEQLRYHRIDFV